MATYTLIKFKNMSPLHIGTGKENYDFSSTNLQSDTISAALAAIMAQQGNQEGIYDFLDSFTISSAFPYSRGYYFLPRPLLGRLDVVIDDMDPYVAQKKLKSIRYIEKSLWEEIICGKSLHIKSTQLHDGFLLPPSGERFSIPSKSVVSQRVSVNRTYEDDAEPFYFDWTFFNNDAGLYCMTDAEGELLERILNLFEILGENGIGTDRSVGGGKFAVETDAFTLPENNTDAVMLLSLYIPQETEIDGIDFDQSRYDLIQRGGFISGSQEAELRHLRKRSVYMFKEGSILKTSKELKGKIVDLQPSNFNDERMHSVFRSGRPFYLSVKLN